MSPPPCFIPSLPARLPSRTLTSQPTTTHFHQAKRRPSRAARHAIACTPAPTTPAAPGPKGKPVLKVGQIVAVKRGANKRPDIARVTGAASSGETVDLVLLEAFVKELYVDGKSPSTFEPASAVRPVPSEYHPSQNGWIVLDQDLSDAKDYFDALAPIAIGAAKASVSIEDNREPLSKDALQRQLFRPTRSQAFLGAAVSVPLAAACYSAFVTARTAYDNSPAGNDLLNASFFRTFILFASAVASLSSLVIGSALFLYAVSSTRNGDDDAAAK